MLKNRKEINVDEFVEDKWSKLREYVQIECLQKLGNAILDEKLFSTQS